MNTVYCSRLQALSHKLGFYALGSLSTEYTSTYTAVENALVRAQLSTAYASPYTAVKTTYTQSYTVVNSEVSEDQYSLPSRVRCLHTAADNTSNEPRTNYSGNPAEFSKISNGYNSLSGDNLEIASTEAESAGNNTNETFDTSAPGTPQRLPTASISISIPSVSTMPTAPTSVTLPECVPANPKLWLSIGKRHFAVYNIANHTMRLALLQTRLPPNACANLGDLLIDEQTPDYTPV